MNFEEEGEDDNKDKDKEEDLCAEGLGPAFSKTCSFLP